MFACMLPVALPNLATECYCSSYSGHVVAPAPSTCLNADSSHVEPETRHMSDGRRTVGSVFYGRGKCSL